MQIDIFSDPICPWCFIGRTRLKKARDLRPTMPMTMRWRTFQLNPDMPPEGIDRHTYLKVKFGSPERAQEIYDQIARVGHDVGIDFNFSAIKRTPSTLNAHRLIHLTQDHNPAATEPLVEALFSAYFFHGQDIGAPETLIALAEQAGVKNNDVEALFAGDEYLNIVKSEDNYARRLGISGVPCFIINGKYALSGAQEAESFLPLFDMAEQEEQTSAPHSK